MSGALVGVGGSDLVGQDRPGGPVDLRELMLDFSGCGALADIAPLVLGLEGCRLSTLVVDFAGSKVPGQKIAHQRSQKCDSVGKCH